MVLDVGVREIFIDAQRKVNVRANLVSKLKKIYETDEKEFFAAFTKLAKHSLVVYTREPAVERTIDFIIAFAVAEHNKSPSKVHEQLQVSFIKLVSQYFFDKVMIEISMINQIFSDVTIYCLK